MSLVPLRSEKRLHALIGEALDLADELGLSEVGIWLDSARVSLARRRPMSSTGVPTPPGWPTTTPG
jgi:hypothetical protein